MNRQQETNQESGAKVFVPQVPSRYDSDIGRWVPTVNLDPAKAFGELDVLLPPEAGRMPAEELVGILTGALENITERDWLLATGDPAVMAIAMTIAVRNLDGLLRILRWDKRSRSYEALEVRL